MDNISLMKRRELLRGLIDEWNANRLDLFEISQPDENLDYHGVMRFLFQDAGSKLATKCIRVSSSATTEDVMETLVEKFRPDMKMLTTPIYHLYEVDSNGSERRLDLSEYPLEVQLNWTKDEKEGKFVLRNAAVKPINVQKADTNESSFKRKLSKREKKEQKKKNDKAKHDDKENANEPSGVFVRTKSNSEAVMRRRRELKVQKKLDEIQKEGDHGGLLKVHGDSLNPDVPYKSLLLSVTDAASYVVKEMLDKYGLTRANPGDFCLVQVFNAHAGEIGGGLRPQEHILEDNECPLAILQLQVNRGNITFHVRRRDGKQHTMNDSSLLPFLLELNLDGSDIMKPKKHLLHQNMTEVGSIAQPSSGQHLRMIGPTILPHHAVIANIEGVVTVTPTSEEAECYVEGTRIMETTVLQHGKVVRFGHHHAFRFLDPAVDESVSSMTLHTMRGAVPNPDAQNGLPSYSPRLDDVLPAGLEFRDEGEDSFLHSVVSDVTEGMCQFKLAPCYSLYLAARYRVDRVQPGMPMDEHYHKLLMFCNKMAFMIRDTVNKYRNSPQELAFWMANMSELLHFFKMDRDLAKHCQQAQDVLADTVQDAFKDLVYIMQGDLYQSMPAFLSDNDNDNEAGEVLHVLSSAMSLLRRCRVNAALTIQLFSQLFHFINMWLFNKLVMEPQLNLITRQWGVRLKRRLSRVEAWAEKQGLELAADCHLCRISQAAHLLQAPKHSADDIAAISSSCFKLNSLQLRALLEQYEPEQGEMPHVPQDIIESVVRVAMNTADDLTRSEGREITVNEDADLQLPFLLPEDGYSSDIIKGIPQGLADFLDPVMADGLCRLTPLPSQSGTWQVFMADVGEDEPSDEMGEAIPNPSQAPPPPLADIDRQSPLPPEPEIIHIRLDKVNGSMGLSIVAAKGETQAEKGIYIKSVVGGGAADLDGRLKAGDQLLEVDGKSLVGLTQERAADLMKDTGQVVDLHVVKQGAIYHGLATLLNQPTPPMSRAGPPSAQDNPSYMVQSKSTPMLNNTAEGFPMKQPSFGGAAVTAGDEMRSKSQGNLMREDDRAKWQQPPGGAISPPDHRNLSQPDLGRGPDSPNYQNYIPGGSGPPPQSAAHLPGSHARPGGPGQYPPPNVASTSQLPNRPRSEFGDPNWYPPQQNNDRQQQPIYQNQMVGKPPTPQQQLAYQPPPHQSPRMNHHQQRFDDRELPSPPGSDRAPPIPPHPTEEDSLPPPPTSDYVNYQINGGGRPLDSQHSRSRLEGPGSSQVDARFNRPPEPQSQQQPPPPQRAGAGDPPPWARGPPQAIQQPRSPNNPPQPRASFAAQPAPYQPQISQPGAPRPLQPGDAIRGAPVIQPYRPPQPSSQIDTRQAPPSGPMSGPRGPVGYRPPQPSVRPYMPGPQGYPNNPGAGYQPGPQGYPGPARAPLVTPQMIQNHVSTNPWNKEADDRRMSDERRIHREDIIRDLESKPYRSPDEEDRLGRLRLDSEFERRAEQARKDNEEDEQLPPPPSRYPAGPAAMSQPPRGPYQPPQIPPQQQQPFRRAGPPANPGAPLNSDPPPGGTVKRDALQSKTVTFKPAYRGEETMRPVEFSKPIIKPGMMPGEPDMRGPPPMNPQTQDLLRQQRDASIASYALSTPERDVLKARLEEELREKQRRDVNDSRRSFHQQEDDEMRRRREHDLNMRKESERIQTQQMNDSHRRYMDQQPPPQPNMQPAHRSPQPNRPDYSMPDRSQQRYSSGGGLPNAPTMNPPSNYRAESDFAPPPASAGPAQSNRFSASYDPHTNSNYPGVSTASLNYPGVSTASPATPNNYTNYLAESDHPTGNTPGVIGAQEVYRDPRSRIEAQQRTQKARSNASNGTGGGGGAGQPGDRMSFRDKMKLFASEAGEGTPVQKPKASKSQRALEESLSYGNGHMS